MGLGAKALSVGDVVNKDDSMSTLVIGCSNCLKSLLSSSIPYLELDSAASALKSADLEVDTNGRQEALLA